MLGKWAPPRAVLLSLLVAATVLAGCADDPGPAEADDGFGLDDELEATATTGVIRGLVVDTSIVPIEGANIELIGQDEETASDADGQFGFSDLEPGSYFLKISRLGYGTVQQGVTVEAGVDKPPLARILLEEDLSSVPFAELQVFQGYLQCGAGLGPAGSLNACALVDSINVFDVPTQSDLNLTQLEMVWTGTNAFGDGLDLGIYDPASLASNFVSVDGPSPQILTVQGDTMEQYYGEDMPSYTFRIFPGNSGDVGFTLVLEQRVEVFVTNFHGYAPEEGWLFIEDGDHPGPAF